MMGTEEGWTLAWTEALKFLCSQYLLEGFDQ